MFSGPIKPTLKPDYEQTLQRFEAWWDGEMIDRPPVTLDVCRPAGDKPTAQEEPGNWRDHWMDVEGVVDRQISAMLNAPFPGDSVPAFYPDLGPDLTATLWGVDLEFGENTSWARHPVNATSDWMNYVDRPPDFTNPYWRTIEAMIARADELNDGRYLIRTPDLHGAYDILVSLRGPDMLCLDLMDDEDLVNRTALNAADTFKQALSRCYQMTTERGYPSSSWIPFLHQGPAYIPSCDFWCLVSDDMARSLVLKTIERELDGMGRSIFHLDGPQALRHLDLLLDIPDLDGVQWVYGAGQGPARNWTDVYRRIVAAGKCAQVLCEDEEDAFAILEELGPAGLFFTMLEPFADEPAAERFLASFDARSRKARRI